jgi:murein DD-endopeptidase MepM/ murein hydrolase activator NlpD
MPSILHSRKIPMRNAALLAGVSLLCAFAGAAEARSRHHEETATGPAASAPPGTLVRWDAPGTEKCMVGTRTWPALDGTCYYPIDLLLKPGPLTVKRAGGGRTETARIAIQPSDYTTQTVELGDTPQANPSKEEMKRAKREEAAVNRMFARKEGPARFTLPLDTPAKPLPMARNFGVNRIFNDTPAGQPHMGVDYPIATGTPIQAVADGTVRIAEDQFFAGNGVYIDHGDGLVSMYFHLSKIDVTPGEEVHKGQTIGQVGATGRATGPHLYFGIRWHNARIDPRFVFEDPAKIPALGVKAASAEGTKRE